MAFCPNCGTPNTDQADKCVSCSFELATRQKAKFKGTIMMTGVQAANAGARPGAPPAANTAPAANAAPAASPAPVPVPAAAHQPGKNLGFEKTIMGAPMGPGFAPAPAQVSPQAAPKDPGQQRIPPQQAVATPAQYSFQQAAAPTHEASASKGFAGDDPYRTSDLPSVPQKSPLKLVVIGIVLLVVAVMLGVFLIKGT